LRKILRRGKEGATFLLEKNYLKQRNHADQGEKEKLSREDRSGGRSRGLIRREKIGVVQTRKEKRWPPNRERERG